MVWSRSQDLKVPYSVSLSWLNIELKYVAKYVTFNKILCYVPNTFHVAHDDGTWKRASMTTISNSVWMFDNIAPDCVQII